MRRSQIIYKTLLYALTIPVMKFIYLPIAWLIIFLGRYFMRGIQAEAIKG